MSHKSKVSLAEQLKNTLTAKLAIGRSKAKDKKEGVDCREYIYSWNTYKTYYKPHTYKKPWKGLVLFPGKSHGQRGLVGYSPWGRKELDMTYLSQVP